MRQASRRTSLHDETAHRLRGHIQAFFKPGDCLPTIIKLSEEMEVSPATLRAAQSMLCQEGFLKPKHGSGVYVTDRVAHRLVAVVSELNILHPRVSLFYRDMIYELREFFKTRQVRTRLYVGEVEPAVAVPKEMTCVEFVTDVAARRFDGIVTVAMDPHPAWMKWVEQFRIPVVGHRQVRYAPNESLREGLRVLREQECRRVAVLWWGHPEVAQGREFAAAAGLETRDGWLRNDLHPSAQGAGWDEFREIWSAMSEKPDGLLVLDDVLFEGTVDAIIGSGVRVPEQLKILVQTHGNASQRYPFPVTVLQDDPREYAQEAGEMLLKLMNGEALPAPVVTLKYQVRALPAWSLGAMVEQSMQKTSQPLAAN